MKFVKNALSIGAISAMGLGTSAASAGVVVAPTITPGTIYEGQSLSLVVGLSSNLPGGSILAYELWVNWGDLSKTFQEGSSFPPDVLTHTYADDGIYSLTFTNGTKPTAQNPTPSFAVERPAGAGGGYQVALSGSFASVTVLNVAPTLTSAPAAVVSLAYGSTFSFTAAATDPGVLDVLSYDWKLDAIDQGDDTDLYDDLINSSSINQAFAPGTYNLGLRVTDGDGGMDFREFTLNVAAIPEPATMSLLGLAGLGLLRRRR